MSTVDQMAAPRKAWLEHLHGCPQCERRQPCRIGLERIEAVRASMVRGESLPEWMQRLQ